jgi:phosphatidate cytidylyltransferase
MNKELLKRILSSLVLISIVIISILQGSIIFNLFILLCFFLTIIEWHKMSKKHNYYVPGIFFLLFSYFSIFYLINQINDDYSYFIFILLTCISTDIGGYIVGKIIKGPKLSKISPKKTYAGMMGSFLFPIIFANFFLESFIFDNSTHMTTEILIFVFCISAISQIGDLIISYFKRISKIKDTGKLIPGHGGILDRIDGMIFAFPFSLVVISTNIISIF